MELVMRRKKAIRRPAIIKAKIEPEASDQFSDWAEAEGRSRQGHAALLFRKLIALRKSNPTGLAALGLLDESATTIKRTGHRARIGD
jgi:hypothetical protein